MLGRMLGAMRFDVDTYEDVEDDRSATWQALAVVVIAALCFGIGSMIAGGKGDVVLLVFLAVLFVVSWAIWALVTWLVGGFLLKTPETVADWGQLARGTGFAWTPWIFTLFVFVHEAVAGMILTLAFIWVFACMVVAVRQCLDYTSTWRAFFVVLISVIPWLILMTVAFAIVGAGAAIFGLGAETSSG